MKMKLMVLTGLMTFQMNVSAQMNDQVVNYINITKDAVNTSLEEILRNDSPEASDDAKANIEKMNKKIEAAVVKFEETVRVNVLSAFSVLLNQYMTLANDNSGQNPARREILNSLETQLNMMAQEKSAVYRKAYLELYKVFPDIPLLEEGQKHDYEWHRFKEIFSVTKDVYFTQSGWRKIKFTTPSVKGVSSMEYLGHGNFLRLSGLSDEARTKLLEGCYTSTCFYLTQTHLITWKNLVDKVLAIPVIEIKLPSDCIDWARNGKCYSYKHAYLYIRRGEELQSVNTLLTTIKTEGVINNLSYMMSSERVEILSGLDKELKGRASCSSIKKFKNALCDETREGCLQKFEVELFQDRHKSKISCLSK